MRTLLLLLSFLIGFKNYSQRIICHPASSTEECVLTYIGFKEYVDDTNVVIIFNPISPLYEAFDGITYQYNKYFYQISISLLVQNDDIRLWTIFHELGHVIDLYNGDLTQFPLTWKGKRMPNNLYWGDRPWEISADKWAYKIWNKVMSYPPPFNPHLNFIDSVKIEKPSCLKH